VLLEFDYGGPAQGLASQGDRQSYGGENLNQSISPCSSAMNGLMSKEEFLRAVRSRQLDSGATLMKFGRIFGDIFDPIPR